MNGMLRVGNRLLLVLALLTTAACDPATHASSVALKEQEIYVEVGESPEALIGRYGRAVDVNNKNDAVYGVSFYSINWPSQEHGAVIVKNGASELRLDTALGVMGSYDKARPAEGLDSYTISLGIPPRNNVGHDEARLKFYEMLGRIQQAGWKWLIYQSQPRLSGAQMFRYYLDASPGLGSLDPNFPPPSE